MGKDINKMHEQSMVGRIQAKGGYFMQLHEQSMTIHPESVLAS